jgi:hypothetical protein
MSFPFCPFSISISFVLFSARTSRLKNFIDSVTKWTNMGISFILFIENICAYHFLTSLMFYVNGLLRPFQSNYLLDREAIEASLVHTRTGHLNFVTWRFPLWAKTHFTQLIQW